jgi:hypothetical protein
VLPRFYRPFRRFRRAARGRMRDEWRGDDVWIVTVNTARAWQLRLNWALGSIAPGQVWRATSILEEAPRNVLKIVVTHHPLIWPADPALPGATHGGRAAVSQLITAGADLFLAGHLHVMRDTMEMEGERKALLVTGGTLCTRLRGDPQGFNIIERQGDRVCIKRYAISEGVAAPIATRRASLDAKGLVMDDDAGAHENAASEPAALSI